MSISGAILLLALALRGGDSITLVTCFPFCQAGAAQKHCIVHATLQKEGGADNVVREGGPRRIKSAETN